MVVVNAYVDVGEEVNRSWHDWEREIVDEVRPRASFYFSASLPGSLQFIGTLLAQAKRTSSHAVFRSGRLSA